jgi:hypothetical protein
MRKRRSETLPKTCRRAEDALPYSTLDGGQNPDQPRCLLMAANGHLGLAWGMRGRMDVYMLDGLDLVWRPWAEKTPKRPSGMPLGLRSDRRPP